METFFAQVVITDIEGPSELNDKEWEVTVTGPYTFTINADTAKHLQQHFPTNPDNPAVFLPHLPPWDGFGWLVCTQSFCPIFFCFSLSIFFCLHRFSENESYSCVIPSCFFVDVNNTRAGLCIVLPFL